MTVAVNVEQQVAPGFLDNMGETMKALRKLRADGVHVLPTHDPEVFQKYPAGIR